MTPAVGSAGSLAERSRVSQGWLVQKQQLQHVVTQTDLSERSACARFTSAFSHYSIKYVVSRRLYRMLDVCWLCVILAGSAVYLLTQFIRFIFADADLTLLWAARFGNSPGNMNQTRL